MTNLQFGESLSLLLGQHYQVETAQDGEQALELFHMRSGASQINAFLPDLVLLDIMMPGIDGIELLKQIRSQYPSIPVIMLTASKTVRTIVQAMKIGAVDYLSKPFEVEELLELVDYTVARASSPNNTSEPPISAAQTKPTNRRRPWSCTLASIL